jgi:hypothetical protein
MTVASGVPRLLSLKSRPSGRQPRGRGKRSLSGRAAERGHDSEVRLGCGTEPFSNPSMISGPLMKPSGLSREACLLR